MADYSNVSCFVVNCKFKNWVPEIVNVIPDAEPLTDSSSIEQNIQQMLK